MTNTTFTIQDADEEAGRDPFIIELPAGINWLDDVRAVLTAHDAAYTEADAARVDLWDAIEEYHHAIAADRAAFKKAVADGGKDPGDEKSTQALRAAQFATEKYRLKRTAADNIIGGTNGSKVLNLIKANAVEYMQQALQQAEHYANTYVSQVLHLSERYNVAHNNLAVAYRVLSWFGDKQDVIDIGVPGNPERATFPQGGPHLAFVRHARETLETRFPEIEARQPKVFEDARG